MDDVAEFAEAMLVIGSNTTEQHPVFGAMLRQGGPSPAAAKLRRGWTPARSTLAEFAAVHLRQRPGTDVAPHQRADAFGDSKRLGTTKTSFVSGAKGSTRIRPVLERYTPELVGQITGIKESQLREAADILCTNFADGGDFGQWGSRQHTTGVINVLSLANLQMLLGNMGVPGGGVNPLRGQNNVQGACDMGRAAERVCQAINRWPTKRSARSFLLLGNWSRPPARQLPMTNSLHHLD